MQFKKIAALIEDRLWYSLFCKIIPTRIRCRRRCTCRWLCWTEVYQPLVQLHMEQIHNRERRKQQQLLAEINPSWNKNLPTNTRCQALSYPLWQKKRVRPYNILCSR